MCREFSCIVTRTGRVYPQVDDPSHTATITQSGGMIRTCDSSSPTITRIDAES